MPEVIAGAVGGTREPGQGSGSSLRDHVSGRRLLLVLDNCEHVLAAVAAVVDDLLEAGRRRGLLATSREGLGVDGERLFAVRSLPAPPPTRATRTRSRHPTPCSSSWIAQRIAPDFALTDENAAAVADICRRLDGIPPAALELAAARVKLPSVEQIRSRLDDRFRLLTGGKTALPRQQTLQAAIQWSYDQLAADEQRLLRALSVFVGGWTLEIAARVVTDDADEFWTLDLLSRLVDKSLVLVDRRADGDTRYTLLETVRQYGAERLVERGDSGAVRRRHAETFLAIAGAPTPSASRRKRGGRSSWPPSTTTSAPRSRFSRQRAREVPGAGWSARLVLAGAFATCSRDAST